MTTQKNTNPIHDIIVLSDLHLGEGRPDGAHRYASTEDFFHDDSFARFLENIKYKYRENPSKILLVFNGDVFDFLTVSQVPSEDEAKARRFSISSAEQKFGLNPTSAKSIYKLEIIAKGHRCFFQALSRYIASGHRVEFVRGNHDLELYFPGVQERLLELMASFDDGANIETLRARVSFHQLFYREEGRVHIEHGNQYDSGNSIRYPLRPLRSKTKRTRKSGDATEDMLDYPLGSIFVKFFYNRVRRLDPHAPRLLSPEQYMDFIRRYNLFDVWRVYKDHYPYFIAALGPSTPLGRADDSVEEDAWQDNAINELTQKTDVGNLYERWIDLKNHPESASKAGVVKRIVTPIFRRGLWLGVFAFSMLYAWLLLFKLIQAVPTVAANTFLTSVFAVVTLGGAAWAWLHLQRKLRLQQRRRSGADRAGAEKLSKLSNVPMVLMGHTHLVDHRVFDNGAIYVNAGTWTSVSNPWNGIMRDARRLTFVLVIGDKLQLQRWNDDALRFDNVPLFIARDDNAEEWPLEQ